MESISEVVSDPGWQALRRSLLGSWQAHARENCERLAVYIDAARSARERRRRLRRVLNYLTGSAFRSGTVSHPAIARLLDRVRRERNQTSTARPDFARRPGRPTSKKEER